MTTYRYFGRTRRVRLDRPLWRQVLSLFGGCCHHLSYHDQDDCPGTWQRDWDDCDIAAKYRTCYACGRSGLVLDCGHMPQPRHIAAGDHHDYCDDCYESLDA